MSGGYPAGYDGTRHCSCLKGKDVCLLSPRLARLTVCIMKQVVSMLSCVHMDVVHNRLFVILNGRGHTHFWLQSCCVYLNAMGLPPLVGGFFVT